MCLATHLSLADRLDQPDFYFQLIYYPIAIGVGQEPGGKYNLKLGKLS